MRRLLPLIVLVAAPSNAGPTAPGVSLPLVAIGLPFAPETPEPASPDHVLYHRIAIDPIADLPATIGIPLSPIAAAKRSSVEAGLHETFARMNFAAPTPADARMRLTVRWIAIATPFHIGATGHSTATLGYRLSRIDTGRTLFDRTITTTAEGGGVDAGLRAINTARVAIAANFASAANCIDHAAYDTVPADCALTPRFRVSIDRAR